MDTSSTRLHSLDEIKDLPDYMRRRAGKCLILIDEYLSYETTVTCVSPKRRKSIIQFCKNKRLHPDTFSRWLKNYEEKGIRGLTPAYGNRKGCSPYVDSILPIAAEIIKPGQTVSATYRELVAACKNRGIKAPSQKTLGRLLKSSSLAARKVKRKRQVITTVKASIDVNTQSPLTSLQQFVSFVRKSPVFTAQVKKDAEPILNYLQNVAGRRSTLALSRPLTLDEIKVLNRYKASQHKRYSAKATTILMANESASMFEVMNAIGHHNSTVRSWINEFTEKGLDFIEVTISCPDRTSRIEQRKHRIIDIIHTPPKTYNINRTTWNYHLIAEVYNTIYNESISVKSVERAVKQSGYTWRRGRKVLTSPDPDYKIKVERILDVLHGLQEGERFFFIDEVGPYRVKKYGGQKLSLKDQIEIIPANQKVRGKVLFIAALEAVTNQLTWRFTADKSAISMVSFIEKLVAEYSYCPKIYLTWDAISVHGSKAVTQWIEQHNLTSKVPHIEVVPLPSNAQFLNVIESVFGGMKKAVICNSDYASPLEMQEAIARHFEERNQYYRDNPKRAGNKIWDKQSFDVDRLIGGLFKKM